MNLSSSHSSTTKAQQREDSKSVSVTARPNYHEPRTKTMVNKWVVLIGVDVYEGPKVETKKDILGKPIEYECLHGAVLDIMQVKEHLIKHMGVKKCRIRTLLTAPWDGESTCPSDGPPTYDNMKLAMQWVLDKAKEGDLVYFHYSGHGAQATTVYPTLKGNQGLDEALAPTDANNGGKYLRDVEIALWLKKVVDRKLQATIVLDCCHSGSATRGSGRVKFRGIPQTYKSTEADKPSSIFIDELLAHGIGRADDEVHEGSILKDSVLLEPQGYALLAACQARQSAREYEDSKGIWHGALTFWLLDTLRKDPSRARSTRNLYRRVSSMIQSIYSDQLPLIGGATDRAFFGIGDIAPVNFIQVTKIYTSGGKVDCVDLDGGTLHGVDKGFKYGIFSSTDEENTVDVSGERLAVVEVIEVTQQKSKAKLDEPVKKGMIEPGCKAVLLSVPPKLQFRIGFSNEVSAEVERLFLQAWNTVPTQRRARMRVLARSERLPVTFIISVNNAENFEILDRDGVSLPNLEPPLSPLPAKDPTSSMRLVYRLEHLALFNMVKALENPDETSAMRRAFEVTILGKSIRRDFSDIAPAKEHNGAYDLNHEEYLRVQVNNTWKQKLHLVVFDLQPLYGVTQVYPSGGDSEPLDKDQTLVVPLRMKIPGNFEGTACVDTFKFIVTPEPTPLAVLELEDLCDAENARKGSGSNNPLQDMLDGLMFGLRNGRCEPIDE